MRRENMYWWPQAGKPLLLQGSSPRCPSSAPAVSFIVNKAWVCMLALFLLWQNTGRAAGLFKPRVGFLRWCVHDEDRIFVWTPLQLSFYIIPQPFFSLLQTSALSLPGPWVGRQPTRSASPPWRGSSTSSSKSNKALKTWYQSTLTDLPRYSSHILLLIPFLLCIMKAIIHMWTRVVPHLFQSMVEKGQEEESLLLSAPFIRNKL